MEQDHVARLDAEEDPIHVAVVRGPNLVEPLPEGPDERPRYRPTPLDLEDVLPDDLADLVVQRAKPLRTGSSPLAAR
jgi:hypothetical protein